MENLEEMDKFLELGRNRKKKKKKKHRSVTSTEAKTMIRKLSKPEV